MRAGREMMTENGDFGVVTKMLDVIEQGDMETFRTYHTPDALIWHNFDETAQDLDTVIAALSHFCANSTDRAYEDRRVTIVGSQAFLQHTLTATLRSGHKLRLPAMMRVEISSDGLVKRLEEYVDSRAMDCLLEE
jgi:hypothetical protein